MRTILITSCLMGALAARLVAQQTASVVQILARDSVTLAASYFSPGRTGPAVVVFRNCDQSRDALADFAQQLRSRGFHVVTYDYRGGRLRDKDWAETRRADSGAVRDWLVRQPGVDVARLAVVGGSCGVQLALDFAMTYQPAVRAAVILSGPHTTSQREFVARSTAFALLAAASRAENSLQYMQPIAQVAMHPASRLILLDGGLHGTNMVREDATFRTTVLDWLAAQVK